MPTSRMPHSASTPCSSTSRLSSNGPFARGPSPPIMSSDSLACSSESVALAGYDIGLVQEPEGTMLLQHFARSVEIFRLAEHPAQSLVLDLRHIDRCVPGGEQRRGADARGDLGG